MSIKKIDAFFAAPRDIHELDDAIGWRYSPQEREALIKHRDALKARAIPNEKLLLAQVNDRIERPIETRSQKVKELLLSIADAVAPIMPLGMIAGGIGGSVFTEHSHPTVQLGGILGGAVVGGLTAGATLASVFGAMFALHAGAEKLFEKSE
jgi:hypothetical protein